MSLEEKGSREYTDKDSLIITKRETGRPKNDGSAITNT